MDRYLIRGFIDGLLSTLGIVIGASTVIGSGQMEASHIIISAGLGGGVANGLSNVLGAFMGEKAALSERYEKVDKAMLKDGAMKGTEVDKKFRDKVISSGIIDGVSTLIGAIIPVIPFIFSIFLGFPPITGLYLSVGISVSIFFVLGAYIGKISKGNIVLSALKMGAFGGATALIVALLRMVI